MKSARQPASRTSSPSTRAIGSRPLTFAVLSIASITKQDWTSLPHTTIVSPAGTLVRASLNQIPVFNKPEVVHDALSMDHYVQQGRLSWSEVANEFRATLRSLLTEDSSLDMPEDIMDFLRCATAQHQDTINFEVELGPTFVPLLKFTPSPKPSPRAKAGKPSPAKLYRLAEESLERVC